MSTTTIQPVRKTITVAAPPETAFEVFTAAMGSWWNPDHSIADAPQEDVVIEPVVGGRWYERATDGSQCDWGRVLVWEPPHRLILAWQLSADFTFDADIRTELEIRFEAVGPDETRVDLEHRGLDGYGDRAEMLRQSFDSPGGWAGLLERFADRITDPTG